MKRNESLSQRLVLKRSLSALNSVSLIMQFLQEIKKEFFSNPRIRCRLAEYSTSKNLLKRYGHSKTIRTKSPISLSGNPLPWYTYPAIEYLDSIDFQQMSAFEFGSGNSTLWWAARVKSLASAESSTKWYQKISSELLHYKNVDYTLNSDLGTYAEDPRALRSDIVVIDGDFRSKCARYLVENSNNCTILIFDNSDWYPDTIQYLSENLLESIRVDFSGFGPINTYSWTTSIFIDKNAPKINFNKNISSRAGIISKSDEDY
jgi:hypothetical protein